MVLTFTYSDSFLLRHVIDSHIHGRDVFDSFLIPLIFRQGPRSFLLRHVLDFMWKLGLRPRNSLEKEYINGIFVAVHNVFHSILIPLIFRHCPSSFLLRHVLDFYIRRRLIPSLSLSEGHDLGAFLLRHVLNIHICGQARLIPSLSPHFHTWHKLLPS
jgi:hypothetical protein